MPLSVNPLAIRASALQRFADPQLARQLYDRGMDEAKRLYPHLYGGPKQQHHIHPKYLGGPNNGPTVELDPAYHQLITNAFRQEHGYGQGSLKPEDVERIMQTVYSSYPLPGVHFDL